LSLAFISLSRRGSCACMFFLWARYNMLCVSIDALDTGCQILQEDSFW
jgi:hypothetical protein